MVLLIALMPIDLNQSSDCERLREWPYLVPGAAQEKEEALADFCAVRQKDLRLHAPGVRTSAAMR